MALQHSFGRPSNILQGCVGEQRDKYLFPCIKGEKIDYLEMTEPGAGSDMRSMSCKAEADGDDFVVNGTKHFISHADVTDFVILFAATGAEDSPRGKRKKITAFLVDMGTPDSPSEKDTTMFRIVVIIMLFWNLIIVDYPRLRF